MTKDEIFALTLAQVFKPSYGLDDYNPMASIVQSMARYNPEPLIVDVDYIRANKDKWIRGIRESMIRRVEDLSVTTVGQVIESWRRYGSVFLNEPQHAKRGVYVSVMRAFLAELVKFGLKSEDLDLPKEVCDRLALPGS